MRIWPLSTTPADPLGIQPELPDITPYLLPAATNAPAVIVCPGGGYGMLCDSYEGHDIAAWLNSFGFAAIVLAYRHAPYRHPAPLLDAARTIRFVRAHADEWHLDAQRIGIMGFSAGGHLAATLATHWDRGNPTDSDPIQHQSSRPDFHLLIYPVITLAGPYAEQTTCDNLLGPDSQPEARLKLSAQLHVSHETPPAFLAHSIADSIVPVQNAQLYVQSLKDHGVPVSYLELTSGNHGLGGGKSAEWNHWQRHCRQWLVTHYLTQTP